MKLDLVHDIQKTYRKVLNCMSRPGLMENIALESSKADISIDFYKASLLLMYLLLDGEVSFKIVSEKEDKITGFIHRLTYAKPAPLEEADFIFVLGDADSTQIENAFRGAKPGTLTDPHKSATIIAEAKKISNEKNFVLKGPGIKEINYAMIEVKGNWAEEREIKNSEYPLGIDAIFVDAHSNIMCIPRTTRISARR